MKPADSKQNSVVHMFPQALQLCVQAALLALGNPFRGGREEEKEERKEERRKRPGEAESRGAKDRGTNHGHSSSLF